MNERVERPAQTTQAEDLGLLAARSADHVHPHRVARIGAQDRRRRVAVGDRAERVGEVDAIAHSLIVDQGGVTHVRRVRHDVLTDAIVQLGEEE